MKKAEAYGADLAYTHDVGFGTFAARAAPAVLALLKRHGIVGGLIVDLGCGSGIWARTLTDAGYDVLGVDYSAAMIALAQKRVPQGRFRHASYLEADLPPCDAVTSIGECLNYLFDRDNDAPLEQLFRRVHASLRPGGLFVFDVIEPGQLPGDEPRMRHRTGDDWAVLVEVEEDGGRQQLTRRITTFRRIGKHYRRSEEVHRLQLYRGREMADRLEKIGFRVRLRRGYGEFRLGRRHAVLEAHKP